MIFVEFDFRHRCVQCSISFRWGNSWFNHVPYSKFVSPYCVAIHGCERRKSTTECWKYTWSCIWSYAYSWWHFGHHWIRYTIVNCVQWCWLSVLQNSWNYCLKGESEPLWLKGQRHLDLMCCFMILIYLKALEKLLVFPEWGRCRYKEMLCYHKLLILFYS